MQWRYGITGAKAKQQTKVDLWFGISEGN